MVQICDFLTVRLYFVIYTQMFIRDHHITTVKELSEGKFWTHLPLLNSHFSNTFTMLSITCSLAYSTPSIFRSYGIGLMFPGLIAQKAP